MEFLKAQGQRIVNESGEGVLLEGYALGNWMVQEAFLFGSGAFHTDFKPFQRAEGMDRGRTINQTIEELCGRTYARTFWRRFLRAYFTRDDVAYLANQGFNSVRLPLNARLLLEEEPGYVWNEDTFQVLDQVLDWCEEYGVYAVLDLHAATVGQSAIGCDDGVDNQPHLFTDEEGRERTIALWEEIARRYGDRACVAGYELLNEPIALPIWDCLRDDLLGFYDECIARIRAIDSRHIIFLQGMRFAQRSDLFRPDMDPDARNWVLVYHVYESLPDLGTIGPLLAERDRLGVPVWVGETGGSKVWTTVFYEMLREYEMGFNVWVYKAASRPDAPTLVTYEPPEGFDGVCAYAQQGAAKPSFARSQAVFDDYIEAVKLENCIRHEDQGHAIRRTAPVCVPAVGYDALPGAGMSFLGHYAYCAFCGYRREDHMELVLEEGVAPYDAGDFRRMAKVPKYGDYPRLFLRLHEGDFACYTVMGSAAATCVHVEARSTAGAVLRLSCDSGRFTCDVPAAGEWEACGALGLPASTATVRLECIEGTVEVRSVIFE
jgi:hypothetical protein